MSELLEILFWLIFCAVMGMLVYLVGDRIVAVQSIEHGVVVESILDPGGTVDVPTRGGRSYKRYIPDTFSFRVILHRDNKIDPVQIPVTRVHFDHIPVGAKVEITVSRGGWSERMFWRRVEGKTLEAEQQ